MREKNRNIGTHILVSIAITLFVVASLIFFLRNNNSRIVKQNESYIVDATKLSASHVNDRIETALNYIYTIASFTSNSLESPEVDTDEIQQLSGENRFDFFQFLPAEGHITTTAGQEVDLSDRPAFINGMEGKTGVTLIADSELTTSHMFSFYSPVYYNGEIIGVLCGIYRDSSMQEVISNDFFGVRAKTYLCLGDGTVITSSGDDNPPENMIELVKKSDMIDSDSLDTLMNAFENHESASFSFRNNSVTTNAYISALNYSDWVLIQAFPSEVTSAMRQESDNAGIILVGCIVFAFASYIIFLMATKRKNEIDLINENEEINRIVESVTELFARFAVVDLENDSYYYVAKNDGMPPKGKYTDLIKYISQFYVDEEDTVPMEELISPEHIREHLDRDSSYLQYEYHITRGVDRWENVSIICLRRDDDGKPVSVLCAVQNITDLKQRELESRIALKNAFDSAKAANRAKSEFLSRMSHDIRTPMNAVMGMTAVAAMHIDDKERLVDCLNKITTSSRHLLALINDILDMSKIESGKVTLSEEPFNLAEMTESIFTIMHPQIKAKNQKISIGTSNVIHEDVIGDTLRLRQVFVNIMGNAVKFTPYGGSISLDIKELDSHIPGKAFYEFVFTDTGIGMEQSFIEEIFEPFSRSKNPDSMKIEGTGLGMPIAKNIVSMMDGDIKVESKIGEGSKFTVRLHLTIQNISETDAKCLDNLRILVADDDEVAAENTREILSSIGMDATSVLSGEEAVEQVVAHHNTGNDFSAVILDWQMPDKNGIQATAEIREKVGESVPIIILSAYDWTDIEQEAREKGVNAFIAKPLFRSRLIYVLKSLVSPVPVETEAIKIDDFTQNQYNGKRILLVEDNELNREIAGELLTMIGVEVEMAFDGRIAVDMVRDKPENYYDLIFMDIQMPNMNGYDATRTIRAMGREDLQKIPIIAMSADAFSDDVYKAKESGMDDHISKPVEIPKLSETLEKWLK